MPDQTPTPDEITAARELLLRAPGVDGTTTLDEVAEIATPIRQFTRAVLAWFGEDRIGDAEVQEQLITLAARHGLRITTNPEPTPAAAWNEPADWPIRGHAPGLYTAYSTGDGEGPAVITEDGRLLIKQDHPTYWADLTDIYQSAQWPLTPITVRTNTAPGELIQYRLVRRAANGWHLHDANASYAPFPGGLSAARADRAEASDTEGGGPRIAAVYLLPEGGKA
ncbi:hypothetical protein [Nocardia cyriacigeorgica]|uniref:hypothetical protein n=1 Tax=Nocardia cyriacigeorgica TaxID=135487 RepID=UPI0018930B78|nr:hypothetical protein [Nocardia cyriacigeorgica]MBF6416927.1 hypothetical protein [Nocardia cyriacigeorgica]